MRNCILAIIALILTLHLSPPAYADMTSPDTVMLGPVSIRAIMNENTTTTLMLDARVNNVGPSSVASVSVRVDSMEIEVVTVLVNEQQADAMTILRERYTEVSVAFPQALEANSSAWLHLELNAHDLQSATFVEEDSSRLRGDFVFYIRPLTPFVNFTFTAVLPRFASLSLNSFVPLFPESDYNLTDGYSLIFVWDIALLQSGQEQVFIIKYQIPNTSTVQIQSSLLGGLLFGVFGLALGLVLAFSGPRVIEKLKQLRAVRYVGVTEEEEEILKTVREKGGSCTQKELYSQFAISQSRMSLILTNLEQRGLIRRFKEGRENTIHIMEQG